jgi:alpha-galactosidase
MKVSIIGAGSAVFAYEIMRDVLVTPDLEEGVFALVDIDARRLELAHQIAEKLIAATGRRWRVEASTDRTQVLADTDYLINTIEVAGLANVRHDFDIPMKYGVNQCIGDTIGPGGIFKALRTLPAWLDILHDAERLAPDALVMNYTNPMSITCLTGLRGSHLPIVGLCHSIPHTAETLAEYLGIPPGDIRYRAAGVNHLSWLVSMTHNGEDLYPRLREKMRNPAIYEQDPIRFEMMLYLGAFVTESSGHFSEYIPYFRKRPDLVEKYTRSEYRGETGFYANNWPRWRDESDAWISKMITGEAELELERGVEYASYIMRAMETDEPTVIYGNVLNTGLVTNLPQDGVVEVACLVNRDGIQPTYFGALPTQLAALDQQHMAVHDLVATAVLEHDREAAFHALMLDPLTAAACSPAEIRQMFDEMAAAEAADLPDWMR